MSKDEILTVKNLSVILGGEAIIDNLSFSVKKGEFISIIGPNGSGKSTLLKALLGILPHKGSVEWKTNSLAYLPQHLSKESFKAFPMTVQDFLNMKNLPHDLSKVSLDNKLLKKQLHSLSAGQFQRIMLLWALSNKEILLLDEPTTGLDIGGEKTIYDLLNELKEMGKTIFIVTHEMNFVSSYSTNVLCMYEACKTMSKPTEINFEKLFGKIKIHQHGRKHD